MGLLSYLRGDDLLADCTRHTPKRGAISAPAENSCRRWRSARPIREGKVGRWLRSAGSASRRVRRFLGDPHG